MKLKLSQIAHSDSESIFSTVKTGLKPYIDAVFGWDDNFQRKRLLTEYEPHWFYWIFSGRQKVGMLCFKEYENSYHVHLLIVFPEFQRQGLGTHIMNYVHHLAKSESRSTVTLSSFICNEKAVRFYQNLGYSIKQSEEYFYSLELRL
ncbi:GNAT family N-acetyltransferase [Vibrio sp. HN007]|uniref:GNAT family N-acetyltransferase n=1 Tax=Vibrio iocasae TaxID=3098914 RepID=UPI0035D3F58F